MILENIPSLQEYFALPSQQVIDGISQETSNKGKPVSFQPNDDSKSGEGYSIQDTGRGQHTYTNTKKR